MSPVRKLVALVARPFKYAWGFVDPQLEAGRIPYGRTIFVMFAIGALVFVGYTLAKKEIRLPFSPDPYYVQVVLPDAAGLDPSKEPAAGVAGAEAGRVTEVEYVDGQAVATLRLDPDMQGKIFADATASLRPINVLQVLIVNINPGNPDTGPLPDGQAITSDRTDAFVGIDELTSILDADTIRQLTLEATLSPVLQAMEPRVRRVYFQLDLDVLDADTVGRANQYACPNGLDGDQVKTAIDLVQQRFKLAALGVASYDPAHDTSGRVRQVAFEVIRHVVALG